MYRFIPTPSHSAVAFGPFTIHFYALAILLGVITAMMVGRIRYNKVGGDPSEILDVAIYAVPAGIIGGRIYHVITSPERYFGSHGSPVEALKIWDGGMGIWGAIALGTAVSYFIFHRESRSANFALFADALAPGLLLAQAVGRFGNWFNGELFGRPTKLPWGLEIPLTLRPSGYEGYSTFHPTFLYESLWCLCAAGVLVLVARRFTLAPGNLFLGYVALYCLGRAMIESIRIDEAHHLFGVRVNEWVSVIGLLLSLSIFISRQLHERSAQER